MIVPFPFATAVPYEPCEAIVTVEVSITPSPLSSVSLDKTVIVTGVRRVVLDASLTVIGAVVVMSGVKTSLNE